MRTRSVVSAFLVLVATSTAEAVEPEVDAKINEAIAAFEAGDTWTGERALSDAKKLAIQKLDWDGLLALSFEYSLIGDDSEAKDTYSLATQFAYDLANYDPNRAGSGADCEGGIMGLESAIMFYDVFYADLPEGPLKDDLRYMRDHAQTNVDKLYDEGCPPVGTLQTIPAVAGANGISHGFPIRGFGDSSTVDEWVPFTFTIGAPPTTVFRAVIRASVKPIGTLVETDGLHLRGASGTDYAVYTAFTSLPAGQWSIIEVDVSGNADIVAAIQSGTLEGVIQDDTAVEWVQLELTAE